MKPEETFVVTQKNPFGGFNHLLHGGEPDSFLLDVCSDAGGMANFAPVFAPVVPTPGAAAAEDKGRIMRLSMPTTFASSPLELKATAPKAASKEDLDWFEGW